MDDPQVLWQPQAGPQTALIACPVFEVFFGGARGGGKTEASIGDWLAHSAAHGENAIGVFFRRKLIQLSEVIARTKKLFIPLGAKWSSQDKTWTMSNGARLKFAYLERDVDAEEYQGHSYTRVYIEEVTNFPDPRPIMKLKATLRSAAGVPCGMRLTGNPGGPGHDWVKQRYIAPGPWQVQVEEETIELPDGSTRMVSLDRVFIPSRLRDNPLLLLNQPTYILQLRRAGSEALVKAWLDGDWDAVEGAYFPEFKNSTHVLPFEWMDRIPREALRFRAMDWGSSRPFSIGWYAVSNGEWGLPVGALLKYREWYGSNGEPNVGLKLTTEQVADGVKERERGEHIFYGVGDPSIFKREGGPSIGETFNVRGVVWRPADRQRKPGWQQVRSRLRGADDRPMLYFLETCYDTLRTLPYAPHDDNDPEDIDTDCEDHALDELRYACMSRPWIPKQAIDFGLVFPKLPHQTTINELIEARRRLRIAQEQY